MPFVISCPQCAKQYTVGDEVNGKQVRCQQCQTTFVAASQTLGPADSLNAPNPSSAPDPSGAPDPLGAPDPFGDPLAGAHGLGTPAATPYGATPQTAAASASNPSGGPDDAKMRLVSGGMLALGVVIILGSIAVEAATETIYIAPIALAPLVIILGLAGVISPDVVRAMGKFGAHLSWHYRAVGWGLVGLYFVILALLLIGFFAAGFRPDRPGRPRGAAPKTPPHQRLES